MNEKVDNKTLILLQKVENISKINKKMLDEIYDKDTTLCKDIDKYFYVNDNSKTKNMALMQRDLEKAIKKIPLSEYKIKWLENSDINELDMRVRVQCNTYEFEKLIENLRSFDKIIKIYNLIMNKIGGKYHNRKILLTFVVKSFRIKK
jgi:hypothetical protein